MKRKTIVIVQETTLCFQWKYLTEPHKEGIKKASVKVYVVVLWALHNTHTGFCFQINKKHDVR